MKPNKVYLFIKCFLLVYFYKITDWRVSSLIIHYWFQITSLLKCHPDLQEEFWEFFQQLHAQPSPLATSSDTTEADYMSQNPPHGNWKRDESEAGCDREEGEESGRAVCAKNISVTSSVEKVVVWTRSESKHSRHTVSGLLIDLLEKVNGVK